MASTAARWPKPSSRVSPRSSNLLSQSPVTRRTVLDRVPPEMRDWCVRARSTRCGPLRRLERDLLRRRAGERRGVLERDRDAGADLAVQLQDAEAPRRQLDPERDLAARRYGERLPGQQNPLGRLARAAEEHRPHGLEGCPARQRRIGVEAEAEPAPAIHPYRRPRAGEARLGGSRRAGGCRARGATGGATGGGDVRSEDAVLAVTEDRIDRLL